MWRCNSRGWKLYLRDQGPDTALVSAGSQGYYNLIYDEDFWEKVGIPLWAVERLERERFGIPETVPDLLPSLTERQGGKADHQK